MSDPYVREVGIAEGIDGNVAVGVDYDSVSLGFGWKNLTRLTPTQAEDFARLFVAACWEAADNAVHMRMDEAMRDDERTSDA